MLIHGTGVLVEKICGSVFVPGLVGWDSKIEKLLRGAQCRARISQKWTNGWMKVMMVETGDEGVNDCENEDDASGHADGVG